MNSTLSHSGRNGRMKRALRILLLHSSLLFVGVGAFGASAAEAIVNGAFDTDQPIVLRAFASRQDAFSAFPKLLGTSTAGVGWYSTIVPDHFELWQPGFFGNP